MTIFEHVVAAKGSLIKARRSFMRERKWKDAQWYTAWPEMAAEWEKAAVAWKNKSQGPG